MTTHVHPALPPLTPRLARLPRDSRGYPIPFFVGYIDGKPEFRLADPEKLAACIRLKLCWTCGQALGRHLTFAIGPMCVVNRISSEPPSHLDCVLWSVKGCPFLSKPKMVRREDELTKSMEDNIAGITIDRNPGVTCAWVTRSYRLIPDHKGQFLLNFADPVSLSWWREGRPATRQEILESFESGIPFLEQACENQSDLDSLHQKRDEALKFIPT